MYISPEGKRYRTFNELDPKEQEKVAYNASVQDLFSTENREDIQYQFEEQISKAGYDFKDFKPHWSLGIGDQYNGCSVSGRVYLNAKLFDKFGGAKEFPAIQKAIFDKDPTDSVRFDIGNSGWRKIQFPDSIDVSTDDGYYDFGDDYQKDVDKIASLIEGDLKEICKNIEKKSLSILEEREALQYLAEFYEANNVYFQDDLDDDWAIGDRIDAEREENLLNEQDYAAKVLGVDVTFQDNGRTIHVEGHDRILDKMDISRDVLPPSPDGELRPLQVLQYLKTIHEIGQDPSIPFPHPDIAEVDRESSIALAHIFDAAFEERLKEPSFFLDTESVRAGHLTALDAARMRMDREYRQGVEKEDFETVIPPWVQECALAGAVVTMNTTERSAFSKDPYRETLNGVANCLATNPKETQPFGDFQANPLWTVSCRESSMPCKGLASDLKALANDRSASEQDLAVGIIDTALAFDRIIPRNACSVPIMNLEGKQQEHSELNAASNMLDSLVNGPVTTLIADRADLLCVSRERGWKDIDPAVARPRDNSERLARAFASPEVLVTRNYADARVLHEATHKPVLVTFTEKNEKSVLWYAKQLHPDAKLTVCGMDRPEDRAVAQELKVPFKCPSLTASEKKNVRSIAEFRNSRGLKSLGLQFGVLDKGRDIKKGQER